MPLFRMQFDLDDKIYQDPQYKEHYLQRSFREGLAKTLAALPYDVETIDRTPYQVVYNLPVQQRITCDMAILDQKEVTDLMIGFRALLNTQMSLKEQESKLLEGMAEIIFGPDYLKVLFF